MGTSYATHGFLIVQAALRREMHLALTRLWDKANGALRMPQIAQTLRDDSFFAAFVKYRGKRIGLRDKHMGVIESTLEEKRRAVLELIDAYSDGGDKRQVVERLLVARNEPLAHRQITPTRLEVAAKTGGISATDEEIESFYQANLDIMILLFSLVMAHAHDLRDTAGIYREHAKYFWASARGECTEGHPNYRGPYAPGYDWIIVATTATMLPQIAHSEVPGRAMTFDGGCMWPVSAPMSLIGPKAAAAYCEKRR
jgi:hypothetical protein